MTFQTHPSELRDDDGNIIPMNLKHLSISDARSKAHRLSAEQFAVECEEAADYYNRGHVTSRVWHRALLEESALRARAMDGTRRIIPR
jgi:hypothetical protein